MRGRAPRFRETGSALGLCSEEAEWLSESLSGLESESHGVQIGWCGLMKTSGVSEDLVYFKLLVLPGGKKAN